VALKARDLLTFEDILDDFEGKFAVWVNDLTNPSRFVIGDRYDSCDVLILVGAYDTRAGGMFLLGSSEAPDAVVINATLQGGRYLPILLSANRSR
jgi:5-methylcytosine-specific restriction protein A